MLIFKIKKYYFEVFLSDKYFKKQRLPKYNLKKINTIIHGRITFATSLIISIFCDKMHHLESI